MATIAPPTAPGGVPDEPPPPKQGPFVSFSNRDFRWLWVGTITVGFGQWGQQIGLNYLVYILTDDAVQMGLVTTVGGLGSLFVTPYAGVLADRYSRRKVMLYSTLFGALQAGVLALLVITDLVQVWHAYVFAILTTFTQAVNQPARQAYVHDVSTPETFSNAIAMNSIAQNLSRIVGPPVAGIIAVWNIGAGFLFVVAVRAIASFATWVMRERPQDKAVSTRNPTRQVLDGFAYLLAEPRLRLLLAVNAVPALLVYPYMNFMPIFADEVFGEERAYGFLVAMIAVGSIVGLFALAWFGEVRRKPQIMLGCFLIYLVLLLVFSRQDTLALGLLMLALAGVFHGTALALNNTVFQSELRPDMRGRGMAAWQIGMALMPLGGLPMGVLIDQFGTQDGVAISHATALAFFIFVAIFGKPLTRSA
ncbi:MAG: MFS transporter [Dehalococcoidia bacterium]